MSALKDKIVSLGGLDYFNKNVMQPHQSSLTTVAEVLALMQQWINATESRLETIEENSGGSVAMASMLNIALADEYFVDDEALAVPMVANSINIDGFAVPIGTSGISWAKPVVEIPNIDWSNTVDSDYNVTGTGKVRIHFGNAGTLTKNISFKRPGEGKIFACRLESTGSRVDTGIQADYSYRFHFKGHTISGNPSVIMDAYVSNSERTGARILGGSQKVQAMWPANREFTDSAVNFRKMFECNLAANDLTIMQNGATYTPSITGHTTSGTIGTTIDLLGSKASGFGNGVMQFAEILDSSGNQLGYFAPYKINGSEVVILNTAGLTAQQIYDIVQNGESSTYATGRIFRPLSGTLIEVTAAEDAAM